MSIKVAVVQSEPKWFDLKGSVLKTNELITEASNQGAELIAFPEVFIPGYPMWLWANAADLEKNNHYIKNSLELDSDEFRSIIETIKANPINVVLGFSERENGSLYISQCIIDKEGEILLKRRKIKPTHVERVMFGDGTTSDIETVTKLSFDNVLKPVEVGCLNCWEHTQPLLTFNSASKHEKIHIGCWPAMSQDTPTYSLSAEGSSVLAKAYAIQTQSFYLSSTAVISEEVMKALGPLPEGMFNFGGGSSAVYAPDGRKISEDLGNEVDGILYATIDMDEIVTNKHLLDVVGHYSRPDLLSLKVHDTNEKVTL